MGLDPEYWTLELRFQTLDFTWNLGPQIPDLGLWEWNLGPQIPDLGLQEWNLG